MMRGTIPSTLSAPARAATACFWLTLAVVLAADLRLVATHVVTACGGLDTAGYVGSARLLLSGHLMQYEPIARVLPFPNATAAAAPLGFVAAGQPYFVSPRFPPGLPLLMAVTLAVGGPAGPFVIAPALAVATVSIVFLFARRTTDPVTAGLAAVMIAIAPIFVDMALQPMSDVPATFWVVLAGWFLWRPRPRATAGALAAGMAILTRPPLLLAAVALGATTRWESRRQAVTFAAGVAAVTVLFLVLQRHIYGHALASGYGTAGQLFALPVLPHNLRFYGGWLLVVCTPALPVLFAAGAAADPRLGLRAGAVLAAVSAPYLIYTPPFEDWEILRFLLPGLPFVFVVCARGVVAIGRRGHGLVGAPILATLVVITLAAGSYAFLQRQHVFNVAVQEQRYRLVGEWFAHTPQRAVAISSLHSGSLRIYAARPTVRAELLPDGSLVETVNALERAGYVPYLALEQDEYEAFDRRFHPFSEAALDVFPEGRVRGVSFLRLSARRSGGPVAAAHLIDRQAAVEGAGHGIVVQHLLADFFRREEAEDRHGSQPAERAGILALLSGGDGPQHGVLLRRSQRCERGAVCGPGRFLDLVERADQQPPFVRLHEFAVEAIDEGRHADVDRAGRVGPRQDALGRGAQHGSLRRAEIGLRRRRLRARGELDPLRGERDPGQQGRPPNRFTPIDLVRGALPLGLPDTLSRSPLRRRAPFAWLTRCRSFACGALHRFRLLISLTA